MAIIAQVTSNSVRESALPNARVQSNASAADFGGIAAEQMTQMGRGLENAGADLSRTAAIMQERENADLLFRAETALKEKQLEFDRQLNERKGAQAWGAAKDGEKFWQDTTTEIRKTFKNDRQIQLFDQTVARQRIAHMDGVARYEADQRRFSVEESANATIVSSIDLAAANAMEWQPRPNVRDLQAGPGDYNVEDFGRRPDGAPKGTGFLGVLRRPDGGVSTELSTSVQFDGREIEIPLLVPTLNRTEVEELLALRDDQQPSKEIVDKAVAHARQRLAQGKDVFATADDARPKDVVSIARDDITRRTQAIAKLNGWPPERAEVELTKNLTMLHKQVIQAQIDKDPRAAREYYELNKEQIAGSERDGIEKVLNEGNVRMTAQEAGDKVMAEGLDESAALAWVRQNYEGEEEAAAVTEIKTRFSERDAAVTAAQKQTTDEAWRVVAGGGGRKQIPAGVWAQLPAKDQIQINDYLRQRAERAKADAEGRAAKTDIAALYDLNKMAVNDPQGFASMNLLTSPEFRKLSTSDQEQMIKLQASVAKGDADIKEMQTLDNQITASVAQLGIKDKTETAIAEGKIRQAIDVEAKARGKALNAAERQQVIDRMFLEGEVASNSWFMPDRDRRVFEVVGTDEAAAFMPADVSQYVRTIPARERQKIESALKNAGRNVTDTEIANLYRMKMGL